MNLHHSQNWTCCLGSLLACLLLAACPTPSHAAWFGLQNETKAPVIIQVSCLVNGQPVPCKPLTLQPGEIAWDAVVQPGERIIVVVDPKVPNRPLFQTKFTCGQTDLFLAVQFVPPGQVRLVPVKPPMPPPRR